MRALLATAALIVSTVVVGAAPALTSPAYASGNHGTSMLARASSSTVRGFHPVGGSHISGIVQLHQMPAGGTAIRLIAFGLTPGHMYRSLYYGNASCQIEPYSSSDVIGGDYMAGQFGVATTSGMADDDLDEIHSVSIRDASRPFSPSDPGTLLACAVVSPGS